MLTLINNRYKVVQQLGQGGMGTVYLVEDMLRENQVLTLKLIHSHALDDRSLAQFKYEFAALAQLRHPDLVTVYDFGQIADTRQYFFTMEYIPGEDLPSLAAHRRSETPDNWTWLYEVTVQVCRALQYIHSRGLIHYDVKPRNIRITQEGQVKLMDFGLIGEARGEGQLRLRGTPEYIAPELIRGDPVDQRADLYALGVSLYEIVTGHLPFEGESSITILKQHVEATPEPPRTFAPEIPEALQTLILRLMARAPANRYASAYEVIRTINELTGLKFPVETEETKRGYIQSGSFVGHEFELARLQGLLMRTVQGQGRLVLITSAAGLGKTRLVRELRLRAQMQRVLVCEGACHEHARTPYRPWIAILTQMIAYQETADPGKLDTYGPALARLVPELAGQLSPEQIAGHAPEDKAGLLEMTARFLLTCEQPLLLILEDLHYADSETVEFLDYLGRRTGEGRLLICGIYRDDEVDNTHTLTNIIRQARQLSRRRSVSTTGSSIELPYDLLRLEPLDEESAGDLVKSMLGIGSSQHSTGLPAGLLARLMAETGGNPRFIESLMHSLVDENLLEYDGRQWQIDVDNLTKIPASIQEAAQRRLERLNDLSLDFLQWAAVAGQWLDMDVLAVVTSLSADQLFNMAAQAVKQHILVVSDQAGQARHRFSDDQMRETIYNTLSRERRAIRHRRIGEALQTTYPEDEVYSLLAWHFTHAEDIQLALKYSKLAGDKARQVYAHDLAIEHYTRALEFMKINPALADLNLQYEILAQREASYNSLGQRQQQLADLGQMAEIAAALGNIDQEVDAVSRRAALSIIMGNYNEARQAAMGALAVARLARKQDSEADLLIHLGLASFNLGELDQAGEYYSAALALTRELGNRSGEALSLMKLGTISNRTGKTQAAIEYYTPALALYRALGDRLGEADALNALGIMSSDSAQRRQYYEQSLALVQAMGERDRMGRSYNNLSLVYWSMGLYGRAREYLEQAVQIQRELQGRGRLVSYMESLGRVYLDLGEYQQAQQVIEEGRALSIDVGDRWAESTYWLLLGRVMLARNHPREAREMIQNACEIQRELGTLGFLSYSLAWLGSAYLTLGDWETALRCTTEAVEHLNTVGNVGDYPSHDVLWLHYQVLKANPERSDDDPISDEIWDVLQRAREMMFDAIATLSDEGMRRNYLNKVRINRDLLAEWTRQATKRQAGEPNAPLIVEIPQAPETERVQDRLKRVLDIGVQMNETHEVERLLNYVMDQVIELSGAERGFLVLLDADGKMEFKVARGITREELERTQAQISYTVLGTVIQSKTPILLQDALADERFSQQSSVLELNLRSVLCVPLISRSELIGMIYADNRSVSGRFSQTDVDLMSIFANQAAIAIENTRLYQETVLAKEELEAWAHTLEQRVDERTAELQRANNALGQRATQLETSSLVAQQVTSILNLDALLSRVVHLIQASFGYYFVSVWLISEKQNAALLSAGTGRIGEVMRQQGFQISLDAPSVVANVCKTGISRVISNVQDAPDFLFVKELPETRAEIVLPLRMSDEMYGVLDITSNKVSPFEAEDRLALQTMADQIAIAIRNARLYEKEKHRRRLAESLERAGRTLSSSLNLQEVPRLILEQLSVVVPYERGSVLLQENNMLHIIAQTGFPEGPETPSIYMPIREGDVYRQVSERGRPVIVDDVLKDPGFQQLDWLPVNRSWIGVPLISRDRVIGMISLTRPEAGAFAEEDGSLITAFAAQAAIALENAGLYAQITRFNEQLEQMVQQRTEELDHAYHTLELMDRNKTDFINVAAHELRTPLTVIKGYTQVLQSRTRQDVEANELLSGILNGADRLHEVVNSMLDVAKIDSQVLTLQREAINLNLLITRVHKQFKIALEERKITLALSNLESLPSIQADGDLLGKVFYHLIMNAIKYTPDGGHISINGRPILENDKPTAVELQFSDTGIGIAVEQQELIFQKFYQTGKVDFHSSGRTKFKGGGPGLGLAIARGIIQAHNGKIWVESSGYDETNCPGSCFYIQLPLE